MDHLVFFFFVPVITFLLLCLHQQNYESAYSRVYLTHVKTKIKRTKQTIFFSYYFLLYFTNKYFIIEYM